MSQDNDSSTVARKDPLDELLNSIKDPNKTNDEKLRLIENSRQQLSNMKSMAYIALSIVIVAVIIIFAGAYIDGFSNCPPDQVCSSSIGSIEANQIILSWIMGFLWSFVVIYFGVSSFGTPKFFKKG